MTGLVLPADLPELRRPVLIAAFEGWNDAGDAATGAVEHLEVSWLAKKVASLEPDDYYDFQVNRPMVSIVDGDTRRISWPTTRVSVCSPPEADRDVVLVRGLEPNMRWRPFCTELLALAAQLGTELVVTLGALLADVPHTRPVPVSGSASDPALARELGLERSRYEGPTGIVGVFGHEATQAGLSSLSCWAAVPHYVAAPPCPKATLALLRRIEDLLDLPEASGEAIAKEFERYLKRGGGEGRTE